ncbi:murein biosynthesis integral membrane protein MurJ [Microcella sp.]|uniref:murein biosynthesis integral membrane protein MurJ n=1 Tax=Microcella sp. TaxID=1913979 RepID=UPI003F6E4DFF
MTTTGDGSIRRASLMLASGTIVSRVLGFVSAVMLTTTIGATGSGANTFALANQLPNNIYAIVAGGVLSAVLVPQIVRASVDDDGGQRFINRLVTIGITVFLVAGVLATLAAPLLVSVYTVSADGSGEGGFTPDEISLAVMFAYWCLPQVLFYALYTLFGEVLNARRVFGPFTWAPAINNVVAIAGMIAFGLLFDADVRDATAWTPAMVAVLGGTATLGVAAQAFVLVLFWRRAGLRYRPDFRWRGAGLGATGRASGWVFAMIIVMQAGGIVQTRVASIAATDDDASLMVMRTAWLLFMLPHSVVVVSLVTAYLTRMSTHARDGDRESVRVDTNEAIRITSLFMTLATVGLIAVAVPFGRVFDATAIDQIAIVLIAFVVGLVPFSVYFVMQRVFYAIDDTRTAFWLQAAHTLFFIIGALFCSLLPVAWIVPGIGLVTSAAAFFQMIIGGVALRRRVGSLDAALIARRTTQFLVAGAAALLVGLLIGWSLGTVGETGFARDTVGGAAASIAIIGLPMIAVYAGALLAMRVPEATAALALARGRLGR